jgi:hypothetical protein
MDTTGHPLSLCKFSPSLKSSAGTAGHFGRKELADTEKVLLRSRCKRVGWILAKAAEDLLNAIRKSIVTRA